MNAVQTRLVTCLVMLFVVACGERGETPPLAETPAAGAGEPADAVDESTAPDHGRVSAADGAEIAWWRSGDGDTTLVLIHGWSCDHEFWREQVPAFAEDFTVVTLDLPGHGESGGARDPWRVADYGADVAALVEALDLAPVVLVGHSMGGLVALATAAELDDGVLGVVAADALHDAELTYTADVAAPAIAGLQADYPGSMHAMFTAMSGTAIDPDITSWIAEKGAASRPAVGIALFSDYTNIDFSALFADAGVPIRAINAEAGGMVPETRIESNREYADFDAIILDGVGHFLQLEAPERFNAALRDVLAELEAG